jgi:hypothetical protein
MTYEARVAGRIGPLTASALPGGALTAPRPATTLLMIVSPESPQVADLARRLDTHHIEIIAIRCHQFAH